MTVGVMLLAVLWLRDRIVLKNTPPPPFLSSLKFSPPPLPSFGLKVEWTFFQ